MFPYLYPEARLHYTAHTADLVESQEIRMKR